jgi:hypothetical protein
MKILGMVVGFLCLALATPSWAQGFSFRGLDARSTKADVSRMFPQAQTQSDCSNGEAVARSSDGVTHCEQLFVESYPLDNLEFRLTFIFNPEGTLRYVSLIKSFGAFRTDEGSVSLGTLHSTFQSLADLLSSKYGSAVADSPLDMMQLNSDDRRREWQPGRSNNWQDGGDRLTLSTEGRQSRTAPGLYRGSVHIFYTFARREEFDRF